MPESCVRHGIATWALLPPRDDETRHCEALRDEAKAERPVL
jgi:hypothetical protein